MRTINPWVNLRSSNSKSHYEADIKPIHSWRGVDVYKWPAGGYLYVLGEMAITHRAECTKSKSTIDNLLTGKEYCSDIVAAHLKKLGYTPTVYP